MNFFCVIESKRKAKRSRYPSWPSAVALAFVITAASGCKKPSQTATASTARLTASQIDPANLKLITETEEKERSDFQDSVVSSALTGDFQNLQSMAADFRINKVRFRNGSWKLGSFYAAFSDYDKITNDAQYLKLIGQLERWATAEPRSVTPRLALAGAYQGFAWLARGSDVANNVSAQQWRLMGERQQKAIYWLGRARGLESDPSLSAMTLHCFLGTQVSRENYEKVFDAGVQNAPDYSALYVYKGYYLLPRWYGKPGEWEQFARAMTARNDIPGHEEIFARIAIYLRSLGCFYSEFSQDDGAWQELKASFRALEKNYPDSLEIKSTFCLMCAKLYDYAEAREQMKLLDGKVDLSVWETKENFLNAVQWLDQDNATLESQRQQSKSQPR
jgi:hypothetical protein